MTSPVSAYSIATHGLQISLFPHCEHSPKTGAVRTVSVSLIQQSRKGSENGSVCSGNGSIPQAVIYPSHDTQNALRPARHRIYSSLTPQSLSHICCDSPSFLSSFRIIFSYAVLLIRHLCFLRNISADCSGVNRESLSFHWFFLSGEYNQQRFRLPCIV